jgi:hypothetical protein
MTGVRFPADVIKGFFSLCHRVQTGSGAHPAFYQMGTGVLSPGIKRPGRKLTSYIRLVPRLRKNDAVPPLLQYVFMACDFIKQWVYIFRTWNLVKHQDYLLYIQSKYP